MKFSNRYCRVPLPDVGPLLWPREEGATKVPARSSSTPSLLRPPCSFPRSFSPVFHDVRHRPSSILNALLLEAMLVPIGLQHSLAMSQRKEQGSKSAFVKPDVDSFPVLSPLSLVIRMLSPPAPLSMKAESPSGVEHSINDESRQTLLLQSSPRCLHAPPRHQQCQPRRSLAPRYQPS